MRKILFLFLVLGLMVGGVSAEDHQSSLEIRLDKNGNKHFIATGSPPAARHPRQKKDDALKSIKFTLDYLGWSKTEVSFDPPRISSFEKDEAAIGFSKATCTYAGNGSYTYTYEKEVSGLSSAGKDSIYTVAMGNPVFYIVHDIRDGKFLGIIIIEDSGSVFLWLSSEIGIKYQNCNCVDIDYKCEERKTSHLNEAGINFYDSQTVQMCNKVWIHQRLSSGDGCEDLADEFQQLSETHAQVLDNFDLTLETLNEANSANEAFAVSLATTLAAKEAVALTLSKVQTQLAEIASRLTGDVNGDNQIGLEEAIHALQVMAGIKPSSGPAKIIQPVVTLGSNPSSYGDNQAIRQDFKSFDLGFVLPDNGDDKTQTLRIDGIEILYVSDLFIMDAVARDADDSSRVSDEEVSITSIPVEGSEDKRRYTVGFNFSNPILIPEGSNNYRSFYYELGLCSEKPLSIDDERILAPHFFLGESLVNAPSGLHYSILNENSEIIHQGQYVYKPGEDAMISPGVWKFTSGGGNCPLTFPDIESGSELEKAARFAVENNYMAIIFGGTFGPDDHVIRGPLMKILHAVAEVNASCQSSNDFAARYPDLNPDAWYFADICSAVQMGLLHAPDEDAGLHPNDPAKWSDIDGSKFPAFIEAGIPTEGEINRGDLALFIYRLLN